MKRRSSLIPSLVAGLALALMTSTHARADNDDVASGSRAGVTPQMTAEWWQWALSIPVDAHPLRAFEPPPDSPPYEVDPSSEFCMLGQHADVWFLGGIFKQVPFDPEGAAAQLKTADSSSDPPNVTRTCEIPLGTTILMPVLNVACNTAEETEGGLPGDAPLRERIDYLKECASFIADEITTAEAYFGREGHPRPLKVRRVSTPLPFPVTFPLDPILDFKDGPDPNPSLAIADGYWAIVKPRSPGTYELSTFGDAPEFAFSLGVKYILTITAAE